MTDFGSFYGNEEFDSFYESENGVRGPQGALVSVGTRTVALQGKTPWMLDGTHETGDFLTIGDGVPPGAGGWSGAVVHNDYLFVLMGTVSGDIVSYKDVLYSSFTTNSSRAAGIIHRIERGGTTWKDVSPTAFTPNNSMWKSTDNGDTWTTVGGDLGGQIRGMVLYGEGDDQVVAMAGTMVDEAGGTQNLDSVCTWDGEDYAPLGPPETMGNFKLHSITNFNGGLAVGATTRIHNTAIPSFFGFWDGTSWSSLGGTGTVFGGSSANYLPGMVEFEGKLYVCGEFTKISGVTITEVGVWDGTSWAQVGDGGFNGAVRAIDVHEGELVIGGTFTLAGAAGAAWGVARLNTDDDTWRPLGSNIPTRVTNNFVIL